MLFKKSHFKLLNFITFGHALACRILVSRPGSNPGPSAVEAQSSNHWTTRNYRLYDRLKA